MRLHYPIVHSFVHVCSRPSVTLGAVSTSNVVRFKSTDELPNLITSHSEYELSDKRRMTSDWMTIEDDANRRYLYNKYKVKRTVEHMPYFLFKEDLNLHCQMGALKSEQVSDIWFVTLLSPKYVDVVQ